MKSLVATRIVVGSLLLSVSLVVVVIVDNVDNVVQAQIIRPLPPAPIPHQDANQGIQRDSGPEAMEIIKKRGFIGQEFSLKSRDGTPLSMYRIINPLADPSNLNRWPVLLMHGIGGDAAQMLGHSEQSFPRRPRVDGQLSVDYNTDYCLPFMLANNNFDVYMGDLRGTNLNNHLIIEDFNPILANRYWNFSLDEQALNDLPALVDFVLDHTGQERLHYIGFSESTTLMFALLSTYAEYQLKLASFVALAPVAYCHHSSGAAPSAAAAVALIPDSINGNYMPQALVDTVAVSLRKLCQYELARQTLCSGTVDAFSGKGTTELSRGFFSTGLKTTSIKVVKHFLQFYAQPRFGMYDYGPMGNLRAYGVLKAPDYDLSAVRLPSLILFRGRKDLLSDPIDQQILIEQVGVKPLLDFNIPHYNHLDMLMAKDVIQQVNRPATQAMLDILIQTTLPFDLSSTRDSNQLTPQQVRIYSIDNQHEPVELSIPDGTRNIEIKSNLVGNLLNGLVQTLNTPRLLAASRNG